jgi:hypothetical protein
VSNSHDNDEWSNDSASLFAEARRAHDPTLAESTQLAAVLARIQSGKVEAAFAANRGAEIVARGATSGMLRLVASVLFGVACIAAVSFAWIRVTSHPSDSGIAPALRGGATSEPARSAKPAPTAVASAPAPSVAQPAIEAQALRGGATSGDGIAPALRGRAISRDEAQARPGSQRRQSRAIAEKQRTSRIEMASVDSAPALRGGVAAPEASSSAPPDNSTSVTVPEIGATRHERAEPGSTQKAAAAIQEVAPRAMSGSGRPQEAVTPAAAARKADPTRPENAGTELAMMKRIQGALREADFSTVLALCAEHARRWPHGVFELEREGVRAIASCGGNSDDAALRAKRFLTAHPRAPVAMRVSAACAAQLMKR